MNCIIVLLSAGTIAAVGETVPWKEVLLLHTAFYIMQLETAGICFGVSAFVRKGSSGIGVGIAALSYFLNIAANLSSTVKFLKYVTPFGYCDGADIVSSGKLNAAMIFIGIGMCAAFAVSAFVKYTRKDLY